jgi:hypothetical protein
MFLFLLIKTLANEISDDAGMQFMKKISSNDYLKVLNLNCI